MSERIVKFEKNSRQYTPSTTEVLLEEMCKTFGTELLPAIIDSGSGTKLVRISKPSLIAQTNRVKKIMQFQYTRFSPVDDSEKMCEVYNSNRKRKLCIESIWKEIKKKHEKWDCISEVTDNEYIEFLKLHRWKKSLYFAVYDIENEEGIEERLKPFLIHEHIQFDGKLPQAHINFSIKPFFVVKYIRENTKNIYDSLSITFPQTEAEYRSRTNIALSLHPLDNLKSPENAIIRDFGRFGENYQIHSRVPRILTMAFIEKYLKEVVSANKK
jgi:hypothetical protein